MMDFTDTTMIVVAAGTGSRFGANMPKQYLDIATPDGTMPVIAATLSRLTEMMPRAQMLVVVSSMWVAHIKSLLTTYGLADRVQTVVGGSSRTESVSNALQSVRPGCRYVGVHDGVRPNVTSDIVLKALEAVREGAEGAIPAIAVTDSLRLVDDGGQSTPVDRTLYRAVQTPQFFPASLLIDAYSHRDPEGTYTDDASVLAAAGYTDIKLTQGSSYNIKITHPLDIKIAELYSHQHNVNQ